RIFRAACDPPDRGVVISREQVRHPEVRAKRASKDAAEAPGPSPFEGRFRGHLRVTEQYQKLIARLATAKPASLIASLKVGCAWQVRAMSSADAPNSMAMAASPIMLPASGPRICTPSTRSVLASAKIFTKPSVVRLTLARALAVNGNFPTL